MACSRTRFCSTVWLFAFPFFADCEQPTARLHPMSSAEVCGRCHFSIVETWKDSAHAHAMDSRLFQDAVAAAEDDLGAGARAICMGCHAPMAAAGGDMKLDRKVSWEGVTCDYCHSVRSIELDGANPRAKMDFSMIKRGPLTNARSVGHPTAFSKEHTSSAICAPCHEYKNAQGLAVLTTYSEWKGSGYGKANKNCQACHMSLVAGKVADAKFERDPTSSVNLHKMSGSHSPMQLNKAVKLRVEMTHEGAQAKVSVDVTNIAAGHSIPTGSPLRQMILEVTAKTLDGKEYKQRRVYTRTVRDAAGNILDKEHFVFLKGASVDSDTRLKPGETRRESFSFDSPAGAPVEVKATLSYYYSPFARKQSDQKVNFLTLSQRLR